MWKFHDFSIAQILREVNFGYSRSAKSAILVHSETQNFDFYEILHFLKVENYQIHQNSQPSKWQRGNFKTCSTEVDFT